MSAGSLLLVVTFAAALPDKAMENSTAVAIAMRKVAAAVAAVDDAVLRWDLGLGDPWTCCPQMGSGGRGSMDLQSSGGIRARVPLWRQ